MEFSVEGWRFSVEVSGYSVKDFIYQCTYFATLSVKVYIVADSLFYLFS